jgi:hypothetical protein
MLSPRPEIVLALAGALILAACGVSEKDILEARARYAATMDGYVVRQQPLATQGGGPAVSEEASPRLDQDVELGLAVRHDLPAGEPRLRGITLDVAQVDAAGRSKRGWRVWVDTAGLEPGREARTVHMLNDVEYAPGDGFRVEVRQKIPEAERPDYRELEQRQLG